MELENYKEKIAALSVLTSYTCGDQMKLIDVHMSNIMGTDNATIQSFPSPMVPKGIRL